MRSRLAAVWHRVVPVRFQSVWRRVFALSWPVMAEQTLRTLMRTVDVVVTAAISPAAVVAVGLADLYARFPLRVGLGLGGGAISLSVRTPGAAPASPGTKPSPRPF